MTAEVLGGRIDELLAARIEANGAYFEREAGRLAELCHQMAERFARGGRLVAIGLSPAARTDVRHVTVEFVHPVIVGKRALPAIGLSREGGPLASQVELIAEPDDIAIAFGPDEDGGDEVGGGARRRSRPGLPDARLRARRRGVGARARCRGPVRPPGARRDRLPRALGAGPRLLRPPRPARRARGEADPRHRPLELPLPLPIRVRGRPRVGHGRRARLGAPEGRPRSPSFAPRPWARAAIS